MQDLLPNNLNLFPGNSDFLACEKHPLIQGILKLGCPAERLFLTANPLKHGSSKRQLSQDLLSHSLANYLKAKCAPVLCKHITEEKLLFHISQVCSVTQD